MTLEEVTRTVRRMRVPREEIPPNPNNFGKMTWKEALEKNLIKAGMSVVFQNTVFKDIAISHDEAGIEQIIAGAVTNGIVVQDKQKNFYVIAFAKFSSNLTLKGRFGKAFGADAIRKIADEICKQTSMKKLERKYYRKLEHSIFVMYSRFFASFLTDSIRDGNYLIDLFENPTRVPLFFVIPKHIHEILPVNVKRESFEIFDGILYMFHVNLKDIVILERCKKVITSEPISIKYNLFDSYIII